MEKALLPPLDKEKAKLMFKFLRHMKYVVRSNASSLSERKKMNLVVFQVLALIDGCYEELPNMKLTMSGVDISSCLHDYFAAIMEDGLP